MDSNIQCSRSLDLLFFFNSLCLERFQQPLLCLTLVNLGTQDL